MIGPISRRSVQRALRWRKRVDGNVDGEPKFCIGVPEEEKRGCSQTVPSSVAARVLETMSFRHFTCEKAICTRLVLGHVGL